MSKFHHSQLSFKEFYNLMPLIDHDPVPKERSMTSLIVSSARVWMPSAK